MISFLIDALFAGIGGYCGIWCWGQIVGSIYAKIVARRMTRGDNPFMGWIAVEYARKNTPAIFLWSIILIGLGLIVQLAFPSRQIFFSIGVSLSFLLTLRSLPQYKEEFLGRMVELGITEEAVKQYMIQVQEDTKYL